MYVIKYHQYTMSVFYTDLILQYYNSIIVLLSSLWCSMCSDCALLILFLS